MDAKPQKPSQEARKCILKALGHALPATNRSDAMRAAHQLCGPYGRAATAGANQVPLYNTKTSKE